MWTGSSWPRPARRRSSRSTSTGLCSSGLPCESWLPASSSVWAATHLEGSWFWFAWLVAFVIGYQAVWRILGEYRDRFMISTIRLFRTHGVFATQRAAIPIIRLVDITVERPVIGRWLNYGHFKFESAAQIQGLYRISYVKDIDEVENILYTVIGGDLPLSKDELEGDGT